MTLRPAARHVLTNVVLMFSGCALILVEPYESKVSKTPSWLRSRANSSLF